MTAAPVLARLSSLACRILVLALAAAAAPAAMGAAFPTHAVHLVVPYAAGQGADTSGRLVAEKLAQRISQPVVVENKPGAGGNIGAGHVARSTPDGYTLLYGTNATNAANRALYKDMGFDPREALMPVALLNRSPMVLSVSADSTLRSLQDLLEQARRQPDTVSVALPSTTARVALAELERLAQVDLYPVAYKASSTSMTDLLGGHVQVVFDTLLATLPLAQAGKIRPLAVTSATASPALPDVPAATDAGVPGMDLTPWSAIFAPRGTPAEVVAYLNREIVQVLRDPDTRERFRNQTGVAVSDDTLLDPDGAAAFVAAESEKWERIIRTAGIVNE
ncbi:tripartite tricarboxylate transporter substrate binding protein [Verticiella sediminum]|uniref:Tripartite tricarboxylate transporter substrate binding protein n=1 Tax=Verticiella sediminum TaxID=1247510 RepID=A0A556AG88_9BURK|nr:tripartite tricarboxylate transporter substrate binding protein [Verticiella sediminum]TSH91894.1 tripartite tricarboxylate transporter substrate binding protein [Verticiella sediminum]